MGAVKQAWLAGHMPPLRLVVLPHVEGPPAPAWLDSLDAAQRCFEGGDVDGAYGYLLLAVEQGGAARAQELWTLFDVLMALPQAA